MEFLLGTPAIYNQKLQDFRNSALKKSAWNDLAKELGLSYEEIKIWYESQRSEIGRIKNLLNKMGGTGMQELMERQLKQWNRLNWLKEYIREKPARRPLRGVSFIGFLK